MKVMQEMNVDGLTIVIKDEGANPQQLESRVELGTQAVEAQCTSIVLREIKNHTMLGGRKVFCVTGYVQDGVYYFDRPNAGEVKLSNDQTAYLDDDGNVTTAPAVSNPPSEGASQPSQPSDVPSEPSSPSEPSTTPEKSTVLTINVNAMPQTYADGVQAFFARDVAAVSVNVDMSTVDKSDRLQCVKDILANIAQAMVGKGIPIFNNNSLENSAYNYEWVLGYYPMNYNSYTGADTGSDKEMTRLGNLIRDNLDITEDKTITFDFKPTVNYMLVQEDSNYVQDRYPDDALPLSMSANYLNVAKDSDADSAVERYAVENFGDFTHWVESGRAVTEPSGETNYLAFDRQYKTGFKEKWAEVRDALFHNNPIDDNSYIIRWHHYSTK